MRRHLAVAITISFLLVTGAACTNAELSVSSQVHQVEKDPASITIEDIFPKGFQTLNGSNNNLRHPAWGMIGRPYRRVAAPNYADGAGEMPSGPPVRYVSNRIFNDGNQNVFSENGVTQWAFTWGQFLDHTFGLRQTDGGEAAPIGYDRHDPLEDFTNDLGGIDFSRTPAAPGTGRTTPREQINTVSSYIDGWAVYGGSATRLEWLREGPVDGDLSNNRAHLLESSNGYLPRVEARGHPDAAPHMDLMGQLQGSPLRAVVAGDVRANENIALTAVHTLFVREHNRIVDALPPELPEQVKFQIARRIVTAEIQRITYEEFLPAVGVDLPRYRGYDRHVNATLTNEFATVGYRAHSMIHGELEAEGEVGEYSDSTLDSLEQHGVEVSVDGNELTLAMPLNLTFGNPDLLEVVGIDSILVGLGGEREYLNDEMIDNQLRSVLFQIPGPEVEDPTECLDGPPLPECFQGVLDLAAIDIERGRDHGMPTYNDLRVAYGLRPQRSFTAITGEKTAEFPKDPKINQHDPIDDPNILDFTRLLDADGERVQPGSDEAEEDVVTAVRRTTVAARLKAIYGNVNKLDAFVGMSAERHVPGSELGQLQRAIWAAQFTALRDGDRFFYLNDPSLKIIRQTFGISANHTLAEIIAANTDIESNELQPDVFQLDG
jgi:hypothetical protein